MTATMQIIPMKFVAIPGISFIEKLYEINTEPITNKQK